MYVVADKRQDISAVAEHLYSIEKYFGFNPTKKIWVPLALTDPALLSSTLCSSQQFLARMAGQKEHPSAIHHMKEAIRTLSKRLQHRSPDINDSTIAAVAGLALVEVGFLTDSIEFN
jgi:Fungal specific transcription factor domain